MKHGRWVWAALGSTLGALVGGAGCSGFADRSSHEDGGDSGAGGAGAMGGAAGAGADASGGLAGQGGAGAGGARPGLGVGEACTETPECRMGLACTDGRCEPGRSSGQGEPCTIGAECEIGLYCAGGECRPAGSGEPGSDCTSDASCRSGLRCEVAGFGLTCVPEGGVDVGGECAGHAECFAGLACLDGECRPEMGVGGPLGRALSFAGVDCEDVAAGGPTRAYFEIADAEQPAGLVHDFFRLPFPNDVRRRPDGLDLTGFPTPGAALLGFDPVQRYVDALAGDAAWGTYPTVHFRFSAAIDFESLRDGDTSADNDPLLWIDITPGSPSLGANAGLVYSFDPNRRKYICENALGVRRWDGVPLEPGHTYAVWLTTAVRDAAGQPLERSPQLAALLAPAAPADPVLGAAHAAYAPLREYFALRGIAADTILNATVFTAGDVREPMRRLAEQVTQAGAPAASGWVRCDGTAVSPCPQAEGDRACAAGPAEYDEYHALVTLPVFQRGTAPYLTPEDGGGIDPTGPVRSEPVCLSLTVPKGAPMPAAGWPLVVTAHGTGGSFRSHVRPEIAGVLSRVATGAGEIRFAVLGFDQVQHGPRRGSSDQAPEDLFFNFTNPAAARGNPLQGAADQIAISLWARSLDLDAATTGGDAIRIDPNAIVFFGHSQGATHGSLALPYADTYRAAVLSGNGASLMHALLEKTRPVDVAAALPLVLGDLDLASGRLPGQPAMHPALALLQQWSDPADPLNFARAIGTEPLAGHAAKHLFQSYGQNDGFAPPITLATFAIAAGLPQAAPAPGVTPDPIEGAPPAAGPLGTPNAQGVVLGLRQYAPAPGSDGHFVVFDVPAANADVARFLALAALGQPPVIGE